MPYLGDTYWQPPVFGPAGDERRLDAGTDGCVNVAGVKQQLWLGGQHHNLRTLGRFDVSVGLERGQGGCTAGGGSHRGILGEENRCAEEVGALPRRRCSLGCAKLDGSSKGKGTPKQCRRESCR